MPFLPFHDPPIPVEGTWSNGSSVISVVFDQPLVDGSLDLDNWIFLPASLQSIADVQATGSAVQITLNGAPASVSSVSYSPPPFDVVAAGTGDEAQAFAEFPVTTV